MHLNAITLEVLPKYLTYPYKHIRMVCYKYGYGMVIIFLLCGMVKKYFFFTYILRTITLSHKSLLSVVY